MSMVNSNENFLRSTKFSLFESKGETTYELAHSNTTAPSGPDSIYSKKNKGEVQKIELAAA